MASEGAGYYGHQDRGAASSEFNAIRAIVDAMLTRVRTATLVKVMAVTNTGGLSEVGFDPAGKHLQTWPNIRFPNHVQVTEPVPGEFLQANPELQLHRGGYEIVDKFSRREIFIEGAVAERFQAGVQELAAGNPGPEVYDEFIAGFAGAAQQPVVLH